MSLPGLRTLTTTFLFILHGPQMLVDKTNFCLVLYDQANFVGRYWSVKQNISFISVLFISQPATHLRHHSV